MSNFDILSNVLKYMLYLTESVIPRGLDWQSASLEHQGSAAPPHQPPPHLPSHATPSWPHPATPTWRPLHTPPFLQLQSPSPRVWVRVWTSCPTTTSSTRASFPPPGAALLPPAAGRQELTLPPGWSSLPGSQPQCQRCYRDITLVTVTGAATGL